MVKIRLMRLGKKNQPYFRVVVADSRSPRDGRFIENIGKYHPRSHPSVIEIDEERAMHWLQNGAQPSDPVKVLLQKTGIWERFTGEPPPPPKEKKERPAEPAAGAAKAEADGEAAPAPEAAEEAVGPEEGTPDTEAEAPEADEASEPEEAPASGDEGASEQ